MTSKTGAAGRMATFVPKLSGILLVTASWLSTAIFGIGTYDFVFYYSGPGIVNTLR